MTAWNSRSRACFAEPPAESPSTRNSSLRSGSCDVQSASLPGNAGPLTMRLRATAFDAFSRTCALVDRELRNLLAGLRMLIQPQAELILDDAGHERRGFARRQALLRLTGELRPPSSSSRARSSRRPTRLPGASFNPFGSRLRNSQNSRIASVRPMRKPFTCVPPCARRDQIDVAFLDLRVAFVDAPRERPFGRFLFAFDAADEQLLAAATRLDRAIRAGTR